MTTHATASSGASPGTARQTDSYVIAVMNQKGGVGKSMTVLSLAAHTAKSNGRALAVDVDPQGTTYDMTQLMDSPGYDVVHELDPAELTRIRQLRDWDTILVDCPGSLEGRDVLDEVLRRSTLLSGVEDADEAGVEDADGWRRDRPAGLVRRGDLVGEVSLAVGEVPGVSR